MDRLQYIPSWQYKEFNTRLDDELPYCIDNLKYKEFTLKDFENYMLASAIASSQIEGSTLDINGFFKAKENKVNNKEVQEIEDLVAAYNYAKNTPLNLDGLLKCHRILSAEFKNITNEQRGVLRSNQVGIRGTQGLIYLAVEPQFVEAEIIKLFTDIEILIKRKLTTKQTLFYAAYIHFLFAKIHPFADGNGRVARLLEKWFLSQKLGATAWGIYSENYYWDNRFTYYGNLNIGATYYESLERLAQTTPFLLMLPKAVCYRPSY